MNKLCLLRCNMGLDGKPFWKHFVHCSMLLLACGHAWRTCNELRGRHMWSAHVRIKHGTRARRVTFYRQGCPRSGFYQFRRTRFLLFLKKIIFFHPIQCCHTHTQTYPHTHPHTHTRIHTLTHTAKPKRLCVESGPIIIYKLLSWHVHRKTYYIYYIISYSAGIYSIPAALTIDAGGILSAFSCAKNGPSTQNTRFLRWFFSSLYNLYLKKN